MINDVSGHSEDLANSGKYFYTREFIGVRVTRKYLFYIVKNGKISNAYFQNTFFAVNFGIMQGQL